VVLGETASYAPGPGISSGLLYSVLPLIEKPIEVFINLGSYYPGPGKKLSFIEINSLFDKGIL
jgi:hypothetical protein